MQWKKMMTKEVKQEQGEPYGYFRYDIRLDAWVQSRDNNKGVAFYTTPQGCDECGNDGGYALYCLVCAEKFFGSKEWVELTNEEILTEWFKIFVPEPGIGKNVTNGVFEFAKAILKIAQANCNGFCGEIECKENKARCKRQKTNET